MFTVPELAAKALGSYLAKHLKRRFGSTEVGLTEFIPSAARLALDCIGNSDALYHNVEHTMLVTLVGYDIMRGRALLIPTDSSDFVHLIIACLFHDIGYVRGILQGDSPHDSVINANGEKIKLPRGASDAMLLPYHVDRSKLFVTERMGESKYLDADRIGRAIEYTRFPPQFEPEALWVINGRYFLSDPDFSAWQVLIGGYARRTHVLQPAGLDSCPSIL